jgi:large subunit ribosomal protein L19e
MNALRLLLLTQVSTRFKEVDTHDAASCVYAFTLFCVLNYIIIWVILNRTKTKSINHIGKNIRKLYKDGLIMKRQVQMHSRSRCKRVHEAKRKGRHNGHGKRKGTRNARMPVKVQWMRRQRVLRRLLRKYRQAKKISSDIYHHFYLASKGNQFKNKSVLIEAIHKMKQEKIRDKQISEQQEARQLKAGLRKERRNHRKAVAMGIVEEVPKKQ